MFLVLLFLGFLTPKQAVAEPITASVCVVVAGVVGYCFGNYRGKEEIRAEKVQVEAEKTLIENQKNKIEAQCVQKDREIKELEEKLRRKIVLAEQEYKQKCPSDRPSLWSENQAALCAGFQERIRLVQEEARRVANQQRLVEAQRAASQGLQH